MPRPIVAVDVGNSRVKLGLFHDVQASGMPEPIRTASVDLIDPQKNLHAPLGDEDLSVASWWIASVNRPTNVRLLEWISKSYPHAAVQIIGREHLPIAVGVEHPERVGVDRLAAAVAANRLRPADEPAITLHVGSAITVNWTSAAGTFEGGAILPGIGMAAKALHQFTDLLPLLDMDELGELALFRATTPPAALGRSTVAAMHAGLYWGAIGAIKELVTRLLIQADTAASVYLTGGAAASVASSLTLALSENELTDRPSRFRPKVVHVPHLVLSGIAIAAASDQVES